MCYVFGFIYVIGCFVVVDDIDYVIIVCGIFGVGVGNVFFLEVVGNFGDFVLFVGVMF